MRIDDLILHLIQDHDHFERHRQLLLCWPPDEVQDYVERQKIAADAHWNTDPTVSLSLANEIIGIGCLLENRGFVALGMMARGDAIKLIGRVDEAWHTLGLAGELYQSVGDEIGWARTRIGRLSVCIHVNCIDEALNDAQTARAIFEQHGESVRALRLEINIAYLHTQMGNYQQALAQLQHSLEIARSWGDEGTDYLGMLYTNIGHAYANLGDLREANRYHQRAHAFFNERGDTLHAAISKANLAHIAMLQGRYRDALNWLHTAGTLTNGEFPVEQIYARRLLIWCYLFLNRYEEARQYALDTLEQCRNMKMMTETGFILLFLATAEAELGNEAAALAALTDAESIFGFMDAQSWVADTRLRRARLAFQRGDGDGVQQEITHVIDYFQSTNQQVNLAEAMLLKGQAAALSQDWETAAHSARSALEVVRKTHAPWLRYSSQLLLGKVAEAQAQTTAAIHRYRAAAGTVERIQRELTITLRPGFLGNKEEALHRLIGLYLRENQPAAAWESLERTKSQTLLNHLVNRENLRWLPGDPRSEPLIDELSRLRQDYAAFNQIIQDMPLSGEVSMRGIPRNEVHESLLQCEQRIRAITEQLYLINGNHPSNAVQMPSIADIQRRIGADEVMVEFYTHHQQLWAFIFDHQCVEAKQLPITMDEFGRILREFESDREFALMICAHKGVFSDDAKQHTAIILEDLQYIYQQLITPIEGYIKGRKRITLVPYGVLHYLPFHLLHDGKHYWIEQAEIVVLPAAGLMLAESPKRTKGALILADDWNGRLPQTLHEGRIVSLILQGDLYCNETAVRQTLMTAPRQVLHIAAHGKYRMDQPDMSYIHLHDGQLLSDDLFQNDLSYELVTLSACETGRARAVSRDELIGLGRGFLYAGAGALIASLWRIEDQITLQLMNHLYTNLQKGYSKAAALRQAQQTFLDETPDLHPLFWGAFQLIGNAEPLSRGD